MNTARIIAPSLVLCSLLLLLGGCKGNSEDNLHRQLLDARAERTALLNGLYEDYGGGTLAESINEGVDNEKPSSPSEESIVDMLKSVVTETDRGAFEAQVDVVGNGERLVAFSKKAQEFFARNDVKDKCRKVVELSQRVSRLERELAALRGSP